MYVIGMGGGNSCETFELIVFFHHSMLGPNIPFHLDL